MEALLAKISISSEVIRDGIEISIPIEDITLGDILVLRVGDIITTDAIALTSNGLEIDESILTGETFPREITQGAEIYQGSHVVGGEGRARVAKIGRETKYAALIKESTSKGTITGFERGSTQFGGLILKSVLALVSLLFIFNIALNRPLLESLLFSLALAVGLTPQLLPVIITVSLAVGARKMATKKVLIKRPDSIEDLGGMTLLCTDKTGTLTTGQLSLRTAVNLEGEDDRDLMRWAAINASLQSSFPNPLDLAIIDTYSNKKIEISRIGEIPYDFTRRRLSVLVLDPSPLLITKGALLEVLKLCTKVRYQGEVVDIESLRGEIDARFRSLSLLGNRVLGLATKDMQEGVKLTESDESEMVFEGFLDFSDPVKPDAPDAIESIHKLGIDVVLITGDNALVAASVAQSVGIKSACILTGSDLGEKSFTELASLVKDVRIFAEVDPLQKERIVRALQFQGDIVGYFGDGVNDAPALHRSDVGISVDTGVDVAKNMASIIMLEKDLAVLAVGIAIGRRTFINTLKYVRVGISAAFGNVLSMAIADLFLPFLPLLPSQVLLLNFMTDFPAVTISGDSVDTEESLRVQKWDIREIRIMMVRFGLISTVFDLLTFAVLHYLYRAQASEFRTAWFVESAFTELSVMLILRTNRPFWKSRPGNGLLWSSIILATLTLALPYSPIASALGFTPLSLGLLLIIVGLISIYIAINEAAKRIWWW